MLSKVIASLVYSDNETPVEKPVDADAPLLTSYDGIEYASSDRPNRIISGRASFKLKISQVLDCCISSFNTCKTKWSELFVGCNLELENTCFGERIFIQETHNLHLQRRSGINEASIMLVNSCQMLVSSTVELFYVIIAIANFTLNSANLCHQVKV